MQVEARQLMRDATRSILTAAVLAVSIWWLTGDLLGLDLGSLFRTVVLLCLGAPLLLWRLADHHPFNRLGVANRITLARGVLTALLAGLIGMGDESRLQMASFSVALMAAVLDGVDGRLARRTGMSSSYGARFDIEADALLILVLSSLAWQFDKAGAWVLGSGLLRYAFVAAAWPLPWLRSPLPPSGRRKTIAVIQTAVLLTAIAPFVPNTVSAALCAVALALLAVSFLQDIAWLKRHAANQHAVGGCRTRM